MIFMHRLEPLRLQLLAAALGAALIGGYVETLQDLSHTLWGATLVSAGAGVLGAVTVHFYDRKFSWMGHAVSGWIAGPVLLLLGGWIFDFKHGLVTSHQWANYAGFAVGAVTALLARWPYSQGWLRKPELGPARTTESPLFRRKPRTTTQDLPGLIRELALALLHNHQMNDRQKHFVEENLLAAINGLIQLERFDKAAQLCRKIPAHRVRLDLALDGLKLDDGLKLAMASFKHDDWGTGLRLLDWALQLYPDNKSLESRVFSTAASVAQQMRILDDTFDAKVIALRLSPKLAQAFRQAPSSMREFQLKRA